MGGERLQLLTRSPRSSRRRRAPPRMRPSSILVAPKAVPDSSRNSPLSTFSSTISESTSQRRFSISEDDDWTRMFEVNVMSGVRLTRHYLKRMLDHKEWGRVVFVSSESAIFVPKEMVHYGFSKAAQLYVARGAAEQTKATNITVNAVLPGPTWVEMAPVRLAARAKGLGTTVDDLVARTFSERRPASLLQRYAQPEEVANLICYLCSKAASATNGAALRVDGGIVTNPF